MPRYKVEIDGKTYVIEGDHPPNETEARQAVGSYKPEPQKSNAGMSTADLQAANLKGRNDLPSSSGFAGNVASSGVKLAKDAITGLPALAGMIAKGIYGQFDPMTAVSNGQALVQAAPVVAKMAKARYGGVNEALGTAYHDPAGVAADISTVAGGAGLAAKAGGAGKIARVLEGISEVANPLSVPSRLASGAARGTASTIVRGTLRPPAAVRNDFGGSKAVADAVLKDRVYSEASASKKLGKSVARADTMLADAQAAGTPGVPRVNVARSVLGEPADTAKLRTRLGVPDQTPDLMDTAKGIFKNNPREIPLTEAQQMKREAQTLAYEAGADNQTVKKSAEIAKAKSLRAGIEDRVPQVGPVNEQSQRLLGSKLAFGAAEDRPRALTNFLSVLGGAGGFAGGGPVGAAIMPLIIKAMDSPRAGAVAGIGLNSLGQGLNPQTIQAALVARLLQQEPDQ